LIGGRRRPRACAIFRAVDKPVVIVNPRSGGGLSEKRWASVVAPLTDGLGAFDTRFTEGPGHARSIAHDEAKAGPAWVAG
jgi:diacylglycerol kinase family enzyme